MTTRQEVYEVIDSERDYQDARWNSSTTPTEGKHTVSEFVLYMEHYLSETRRLLSTQASPKAERDALDMLRKVVAMGVSCMEQNGVVARVSVKDAMASVDLSGLDEYSDK